MKVLAMYLPQFHRVKENDEWWGEGYTEWTAVRNAKPLFEGHNQPRIPLHEKYYDLLEKDTMKNQAELAKKYGIDGFCFYHYYFKDGRKILEKPAENLLRWNDIDMPYCFCWANETWARTWSNVTGGNSWGSKFEKKKSVEENGILLKQDYGNEDEWLKHIEYMLPFFQDARYIKRDGRPVFLIYKPDQIYCLGRMVDVWNEFLYKRMKTNLYVIGVNTSHRIAGTDAVLFLGPGAYRTTDLTGEVLKTEKKNDVLINSYTDICKIALEMLPVNECQTYFSAISGYDDTPRHGDRGICIEGSTPELFEKHLIEIMEKNESLGSDMTFINAWNEWGEGMFLEPDEHFSYAYLEAVKHCKEPEKVVEEKKGETGQVEKIDKFRRSTNKYKEYYEIMSCWLDLKNREISIGSLLQNRGYKKIILYGFGNIGKKVYSELLNSSIEVLYVVDKYSTEKKIIRLENLKYIEGTADAVIVTPTYDFAIIYDDLKKIVSCPVISFLEIIREGA